VTKVAETLGVAVDKINDPDSLKPILNQLGAAHVDRGVLKEHYPVVMNAIMKTLKDNLGDTWTPQVEKSW
jgi:hemoglobin-like flavoprotein